MRGLFWGELIFGFRAVSGESGVFPAGLMDLIDVRENLFQA
jgi:hypothetical protein